MKIYAGMVAPEKHGVKTSRWATIEGDTITVTNIAIHTARVHDLKLQGYEIMDLDTEIMRRIVQGIL